MGEQSEEALVEQGGAGRHQLHLGPVEAAIGVEVSHGLDRQIEDVVEVEHGLVLVGDQRQRGRREGRPDRGHPAAVEGGVVGHPARRLGVTGGGQLGRVASDGQGEGVDRGQPGHQAEYLHIGGGRDPGLLQLADPRLPNGGRGHRHAMDHLGQGFARRRGSGLAALAPVAGRRS